MSNKYWTPAEMFREWTDTQIVALSFAIPMGVILLTLWLVE